jgi:hypothetical protein
MPGQEVRRYKLSGQNNGQLTTDGFLMEKARRARRVFQMLSHKNWCPEGSS